MAAFRVGKDELEHGLPWLLMQNGSVTKYWRRERLDEDAEELGKLGFTVCRFDCAAWANDRTMHDQLRVELGLPGYTGQSFDALQDSLTDMEVPETGGLVVALDNFDDRRPRDAALLHVLAESARWWLLFGRLQPILIRTDDARHEGPSDLGATAAEWNRHEWQDDARGL